MTPYYSHAGITIFLGNNRDVLPTLEAGSVDLVLTDPPYGVDWGFTGQGSGASTSGTRESQFAGMKIVGDQCDFDPSFLLHYPKVILWGFHHYPQHLSRGSVLIWLKKYDSAFGSFLSDADIAWMKGGCGVYAHRTINPTSFQSERVHPTQKPVALMTWCIELAGSRGLILDPFMGSGSTLVAAKLLGRKAIGIDIEERWCEAAAKRLQQEMLPMNGGDAPNPEAQLTLEAAH